MYCFTFLPPLWWSSALLAANPTVTMVWKLNRPTSLPRVLNWSYSSTRKLNIGHVQNHCKYNNRISHFRKTKWKHVYIQETLKRNSSTRREGLTEWGTITNTFFLLNCYVEVIFPVTTVNSTAELKPTHRFEVF